MDGASQSRTSPSLLGQLRQDPTDQAAWARFVEQYGPMIYRWCRKRGLQEADAQDVTQNVLLKLADKMRAFPYDPARSFRAWLSTLTRHACCDFLASRQGPDVGTGDSEMGELLGSVEARQDLAKRLEEAFDQELLAEATRLVRQRIAPHRWEAYRLTALEGLSGAEAAERLKMPVAQVFVAKSDVLQLLRDEVRQLEGPGGP
jgi:RNA polymerase sigma-70 factor (ECF subfamily)